MSDLVLAKMAKSTQLEVPFVRVGHTFQEGSGFTDYAFSNCEVSRKETSHL
jgi:hypothetical protein